MAPVKATKWIVTYVHHDGREEEAAYNDLKIMEQDLEFYDDEPERIDGIIQVDINGYDITATDITDRYKK